ncbi:protein lingerer-like isoform X2 [Rhodnius prolixus]|uniref:protein lingerer-like isoform X2 n=1 Tax=Rhodnius prolixus TaxID=13249 RepID=UPI003D1896AA
MHQSNKSRKAKNSITSSNLASTNDSLQTNNNKTVKQNEMKNEFNVKFNEKSQPTAEQMTIAQIIDTKSEDPALKDKLKQVMDATQRSADEAYTALHDSDNDPNRAVNLLLEGGTKDEWSTSSKKKKIRVPAEKAKEGVPASDVPVIASRGSGTTTLANQERSPERLPARRGRGVPAVIANGPGRGSRGGLRSRTSGRGGSFVGGRGMRGPFRKPIETWDGCVNNTSTTQNDTNHEHNCSAPLEEDWDSEEFTGSLANSQVFTPSSGQIHDSRSVRVEEEVSSQQPIDRMDLKTDFTEKTEITQNRNHTLTPSRLISHFASMQIQQQMKSPINQNCTVVMDGTLTSRDINQVNQALVSKYNYLTAIRGTSRPSMQSSMVPQLQDANSLTDIRIPRIAQTRIPLTAVEMPPDVGTSLGLLDVQFGALEFGETNSESVVNSPSTPHRSPSPSTSDDLNPPVSLSHVWCQGGSTEALLAGNDRSFSPVRGTTTVTNSLQSQLVDNVTKIGETTSGSGGYYQDSQLYQTSLYTKATPQTIYNSTYCSPQVLTSNNTVYSTSSQNIYSSSSMGTYGTSGYPNYQYSSYGSSHPPNMQTNTSNSYQSSMGMGSQNYGGGTSSVYGVTSALGTSSYSTPPYPTYNSSSQHNHKSLTSTAANSKEFDSPAATVNLNSISHSATISVTPTLLSSTQTTTSTKPGNISNMSKGSAMTNMPAGVPSLVGAQYTIVGQGGVPYIQQPPVYYEDFQLMQQQRLPPHIPITNLDTLASSVYGQRRAQATAVNQSGSQAGHQQPLLNPTMPPAYAYFYGGSMIPGNFQFSGPTIYPVPAAGTTSGHNNTSSGPYGKGPSSYPTAGSYTTGIYDGSQATSVGVSDYKTSNNAANVSVTVGTAGAVPGPGPKGHPAGPPAGPSQQPANNPPTTSDISNMYTKSHSALSKVGTYDKQGFHCATPPPFNLTSQNSGMGPAPGYPQHLFIPTMAAHHNTTLLHQQIHQDGSSSVNARSQSTSGNKPAPKNNYSSTYWTQN